MSSAYDCIGRGYDVTRRADPQIAQRVFALLNGAKDHEYVDVGCGTGSYTIAFHNMGLIIHGVDQSEFMISRAREKAAHMAWYGGDAEALPFPCRRFQGVTCILAIHHFNNLGKAFSEMFRVVDQGRVVIFTAYPEQTLRYWLNEYFPRAMRRTMQQMPSRTALFGHLESAGFKQIMEEGFIVQPDLQDLFLQSGKHNPEIYLRPEVRAGISTFANVACEDEVSEGCRRLEQDIRSGRIDQVMADYASPGGDYVFVVAEKI